MKVKSESEVAQSCPTLSNPMDCSLPGSSTHGIFQARVLEWAAIAFSDPQSTNCLFISIHIFSVLFIFTDSQFFLHLYIILLSVKDVKIFFLFLSISIFCSFLYETKIHNFDIVNFIKFFYLNSSGINFYKQYKIRIYLYFSPFQ